MPDNLHIPLPEPGSLLLGAAPHWHGLPGIVPLTLTFLIAAAAVAVSGMVLFGWYAVRVLAISVATALLLEASFHLLTRRSRAWSESHALLVGALLACTLPPTVEWYVPVVGSAVAVLVGHALLGGIGNYLWHPVALGRVAAQMLLGNSLCPEQWPVLAPRHLIWGDLTAAQPLPALWSWGSHAVPDGVEALSAMRSVDHLCATITTHADAPPAGAIAALMRESLPPWPDTLVGTAGGAIGEACAITVVIAGLFLMWRGLLRGQMVLVALATAALLAAVLPVDIQPVGGQAYSYWLPGTAVWRGLPVGLAYVCYHLTGGEFLLVLLLLAPDPSSSPLTARGHAVFGMIIAAVTMALRILVGLPGAGYWALLIANTCVPTINRITRRPVFGT